MPHELEHVRLGLIDIDHVPLNPKVFRFAMVMNCYGYSFPPIKLERKRGGRFQLKDGRHRFAASKLTGQEFILARVAPKEKRK